MESENPQVRFAAIKIGPNRFKNVAKIDPLPPIRKTKESIGQVKINVEDATLEVSTSSENLKADLSKLTELDLNWVQFITPHKFKSDLYDLRRRMFLRKRSRIRLYNCGCKNTYRRKGLCLTDYWYWLLFAVTFWPLTGYILAMSKGMNFKRPWIFLVFGTVAWISQLVCVSIFLHDCIFGNCAASLWSSKYIACLTVILLFHLFVICLFTALRIHFTEIYHKQKKIFRSFLVTLFLCPCSIAQIATQLEENPFLEINRNS